MPIKYSDIKKFCKREYNAEQEEWRNTLNSTIGHLLKNDLGVECEVINKTTLQPCTDGYKFRDTEQVCILTNNIDRNTQYADVRGAGRNIFLKEITADGNLILKYNATQDIGDKVLVMPSEPLLEYYNWQIKIIDKHFNNSSRERTENVMSIDNLLNLPIQNSSHIIITGEDILEKVFENESNPILIQGPPGCGKTYNTADIIKHALDERLSVGVFTFTNRACDQVLNTFVKRYEKYTRKVLRVGNQDGVEEYGIDALKLINPQQGKVIGSTIYQLTNWVCKQGNELSHFDILIIDEASQATIPMILPAVICSSKLVLVGDQKQLAPLIKQQPDNKIPEEIYSSAFEYLTNRINYLFLKDTFRMRDGVCEIPSKAFYNSELTSHEDANKLDWEHDNEYLSFNPGIQLIIVPNSDDSKQTSENEALLIRDIIDAWERDMQDIQKSKDEEIRRYLISCFYRSQVSKVRGKLKYLKGISFHVDSVERNQGQTTKVAFLSIADRGNGDRGQNWAFDPKRLNVAITRAKLKCYVLAPPEFVKMAISDKNPYEESRNAWILMNENKIII